MKIGIAGAGLMGKLIAWELINRNVAVTIFEKNISGEASAAYAAAGMLSPYAECDAEREILSKGSKAVFLWKNIVKNLSREDILQCRGSLVVAHAEDQNQLQNFIDKINYKINKPKFIKLLDKEVQGYEPDLAVNNAVFLPDEGLIDNRELLKTLHSGITKSAKVINENVQSVQENTILTKENRHRFDWVIDCRGMGGKEYFNDLRAVRGELIYLHAPEVTLTRPIRLLHPRYKIYIVPRPNSVYLIGASEIESDDQSPISVRSCLELLSAAYSLHRGFAEARILETVSALRPALNDNVPKIIYENSLIAVNGLYRHGFLLAPILLDEIIEHLAKSGAI